MRFIHVVVLAAISYAAYSYWDKSKERTEFEVSGPEYSDNGFAILPGVLDQDEGTVYVIAPPNCPKESARRARQLAKDLDDQGIPVVETNKVNFSWKERPTSETLDSVNSVMKGEIPIVIVNGRGKANPLLEEVVAEYGGAGGLSGRADG